MTSLFPIVSQNSTLPIRINSTLLIIYGESVYNQSFYKFPESKEICLMKTPKLTFVKDLNILNFFLFCLKCYITIF